MKKAISAALAMLLLTMSACGGRSAIKEIDAVSVSKLTAAAYELVLPEYTEDLWISSFAVVGQSAYFIGSSTDAYELCRCEESESRNSLCTFNPLEMTPLDITAGSEERLLMLARRQDGENSSYRLLEFDTDGMQLAEYALDFSETPDNWTPVKLEFSDDIAFLLGGGSLCAVKLNGEGKLLYCLETELSASFAIMQDGRLALGQSGGDAWSLTILEPENGETIAEYSFNLSLNVLCGGVNQSLYLDDGTAVYGFSPKSGGLKKLFTWSGLGIMGGEVAELPDGELLCSGKLDAAEPNGLLHIRPISGDENEIGAEPLTIATLSGQNMNYKLSEAIRSWNQRNPEWAIEVIDYSSYADGNDMRAAELKLIADVSSGNGPDMYDFGQPAGGEPISAALYARRGLLEDLYPYIDSDAELSRDAFLTGVLNSAEVGGSLYELLIDYRVVTTFADAREAGTDWTYYGLNAAVEVSGRYTSLFDEYQSQMDLLRLTVFSSGDRLIDWNSGECGFNSEYFVDLLEAAAELPETGEPYASSIEEEIEGSSGLLYVINMDSLWNVSSAAWVFNENYAFVGLPEVGSVVYPVSSVGISSGSEHKDKCWEFVREMFTDEEYNLSFSMLRETMRLEAENEIEQAVKGNYIQYHPYAEQAMEDFLEVLENISAMYRYDSQLWSIVSDEAGMYFAGEKTALDTAAAIQSRAEIYMAEQSS